MFAPLVLAAEAAYLGFIGTHPRFQRHVDAQEHKAARAQSNAEAVERLMRRCLPRSFAAFKLSKIAAFRCGRSPSSCASPTVRRRCARSTSFSSPILTACSGSTCAHSTRSTCSSGFSRARACEQIQSEIKRLEERIRRLDKEPDSRQPDADQAISAGQPGDRQVAALQSRKGHARITSLLQAEIENLETKIQSITELAINRSDAEAITGQVEADHAGIWSAPSRRSTIWGLPPAANRST